jgi:glycosyltransferase involved in cell wall biosynthesis
VAGGSELKISVIVPVWNREDEIGRCLESLTSQSLPSSAYEVIVVDNGSSDATRDVATSYQGVKVLIERRPGSYAARNLGLATARGEYVAFTDSDCIPDSRWLEHGLRALEENPLAGVIAGRVELYAPDDAVPSVCSCYERIFAFNQEANIIRGRAATANWFSSAAILRELGGFREDLMSGGDFELAKRLQSAEHQLIYLPEAIVFHPARVTFAELSGKARRVIGGRFAMAEPIRRNPLRWWYSLGRNAGRKIARVLRTKTIDTGMKLRLSLLIVALYGVVYVEVVALCLGGAMRRS